jgi:hypothetical protein
MNFLLSSDALCLPLFSQERCLINSSYFCSLRLAMLLASGTQSASFANVLTLKSSFSELPCNSLRADRILGTEDVNMQR